MAIKKYFFQYVADGSAITSYLNRQVDQSTLPQSVSVGADGIEVEIEESAFEDVEGALTTKFDVEYYGEITGNTYKSKGALADRPDSSEFPEGTRYFAGDQNTNYHVHNGTWSQDEAVEWTLQTDIFVAPTIAYTSRSFEVGSVGTSNPVVLSGTTPILSWELVGTLPSEFTFDTATGVLSYDTTGSVSSSGSFQVTASNPAGTSGLYDFDWVISDGNGISEYTNTIIPYAAVRLSPSGYSSARVFAKLPFFGKTTNIFDGTIIEDSAYPIYSFSNGDGTFDYLIYPEGYPYWMLFERSSTDPHGIVNGLVSDITYSSLVVDFICPTSDNITYDGVDYPSDQSDVHYLTTTKYTTLGVNSAFDGFMSADSNWSFGFTLDEDMPLDGLGRVMFCRFPRNWTAFYLGHSSNRTRFIYGNGSTRDDSSNDDYPASGLVSGTKIHAEYNGVTMSVFADGTLTFSATVVELFDNASSSDNLELRFGMSPESDGDQSSDRMFHGFWQGLITDLWLSTGTIEDGSLGIPAGCSHSWPLSETTGSTFVASKGGIDLIGKSVS